MTTDKKKIWIILDHPWQLSLALAIRAACPINTSFNLIISRHKYWKSIEGDSYQGQFNQVLFFEEPERAHNLKGAFRFIKSVKELRKQIEKLPVGEEDVFLTLSYFKYVENIMTSVFSRNKQIFLCRSDMRGLVHKKLSEILFSKEFWITKSGWAHYLLLEPLLKLKKRTLFYWIKGKEQTHETSYSQPVEILYDKVFVIKSLFKKNLEATEIYFPYYLLRNEQKQTGERKRIVFFLADFVRNENYYDKISQILQNLRKQYQDQYLLEIRLHPNKLNEFELVNCDGWTVNREPGNAEQYLIRHASEIAFAISHLSTSVLFAASIGIPAYTYHRCFGFNSNFMQRFERIFADMPEEFFLISLESIPGPYITKSVGPNEIRNSLQKLYNILY